MYFLRKIKLIYKQNLLIILEWGIVLPKMFVGKGVTWEKESRTYEIGTFVTDRNKNYCSLEFIVNNRPGVIFRISQKFAEKNINIVQFIHSNTQEENSAIFVVGDFTDSKVSPEELLDELRRDSEYILKVKFADKTRNIYYSSHLFPITLDGHRVVLFGPADMHGLIYGLRKDLGVVMTNSLLYHLGYGVGEAIYEYYFKPKGYSPENLDGIMNLIDAILVSYGWGKLKGYLFDENKIIVDIEDLWECEIQKKIGTPQGSSYFRGVLGGFFETIYNLKMDIKETKCISKGDDSCRFEITLLE